MSAVLIRGGRLGLDPAAQVDLRLRDGRIVELGSGLEAAAEDCVVDATGLWILPGAIDNHVHFRDPGLTHKEDYGSGSRGALRGGVTTVLEVQNNEPLLLDAQRCRSKVRDVGARSLVNFGIYPNLLEQTLGTALEMAPYAAGYKLYMGASTGMGGQTDYGLMRELFRAARKTERPLVLHCEEESVLSRAMRDSELGIHDHGSRARPPIAEVLSIAMAIEMAREWDTEIHVFHLSTMRGLELISQARREGVRVSCSTCPHYLYFTEEDSGRLGNLLKVNPAIHGASDREALLAGLAAGEIEVLSTDHAPHTLAEKERAYPDAPAGIPSVDLLYPLLLTLVKKGSLTLERAIESVTLAPARLHGLAERGSIRVGWHADLCLVDPERWKTVGKEDLSSRSGYTPYEGT
ncbi:MAG: dihydroorotase family protein, partial [Planctomycetota bacterium]